MDDLVLQRPLEVEAPTHHDDIFYTDRDLQIDIHNGEVDLLISDGEWFLSLLANLTLGVEGAGNYLIFRHDRVLLISDASQLGVMQVVELRPDPETYKFAPTLPIDVKLTSRVNMRVKYSNIRSLIALPQYKPTKSHNRAVHIRKARGRGDLEVTTRDMVEPGDELSAQLVTCSVISHPPIPPDSRSATLMWSGPVSDLVTALASIVVNKSDVVFMYIRTDGSGIHFYTYHPTTGQGNRSSVGPIPESDFRLEEHNTRLVPTSRNYITYRVSRRGLRVMQKLGHERPATLHLYCVTETIAMFECVVAEEHTHRYYLL